MRLLDVTVNALGIVREFWADDDGNITVNAKQAIDPIFDNNRVNANERGKRITSEVSNPVASIPHIVALKWLNEEGWWFGDADRDPDVDRKLKAKLNSSEYRYLRTSELTL